MNYTETGLPCAECGQEYIKTDDGVGGCLNCDCDMSHPQCKEILESENYDESE